MTAVAEVLNDDSRSRTQPMVDDGRSHGTQPMVDDGRSHGTQPLRTTCANAGIWTRGRRGQMMVVFGLTLSIFMGALMLGVDLSRLRTEAENAQRAANAAALAGV